MPYYHNKINKKIKPVLEDFSNHKNISALKLLITTFSLEAENLDSFEYYDTDELINIINQSSRKLKQKTMSTRRRTKEKVNKDSDIFVKGISVFEPHPKAPDFCVATILINRDELIEWLDAKKNDKFFSESEKYGDVLTLSLNESKEGNLYLAINKYNTPSFEEEEKEEEHEERKNRRGNRNR